MKTARWGGWVSALNAESVTLITPCIANGPSWQNMAQAEASGHMWMHKCVVTSRSDLQKTCNAVHLKERLQLGLKVMPRFTVVEDHRDFRSLHIPGIGVATAGSSVVGCPTIGRIKLNGRLPMYWSGSPRAACTKSECVRNLGPADRAGTEEGNG